MSTRRSTLPAGLAGLLARPALAQPAAGPAAAMGDLRYPFNWPALPYV